MNLYLKRVRELVNSRYYLLCVSLVFIACFGFVATHISIGIDDLFSEYYFGGESFGQGRFTTALVSRILSLSEPLPIIPEMLYGIFMLFASICFLYLIENALGIILDTTKCVLFTALFISYPLVAELYVYNGNAITLGLGYLLTALSLLYAFSWIKNKGAKSLGASILLMMSAISAYESFAEVYICCVAGIMLLQTVVSKERISNRILIASAKYAAILLIAIVLEFAVSKAAIIILGIEISTYAATSSVLGTTDLVHTLLLLVKNLGWQVINAFRYLPIRIYIVCILIGAVNALIWWTKKKKISILFLYIAFVASTWLMSLLMGEFVFRTNQAFALFVAFVGLSTLISIDHLKLKQGWKYPAVALTILVVIWQSIDLNGWFLLENRKYEEERSVLLSVSDRLHKEQDISKPVIFVGNYELSDDILKHVRFSIDESRMIAGMIKKLGVSSKSADEVASGGALRYNYVQTTIRSCISWSVIAFGAKDFGVNGALIKFFRYLGIDDIKQGTYEMYEEAEKLAVDMKAWPDSTSIVDVGAYIIVNFGINQQ